MCSGLLCDGEPAEARIRTGALPLHAGGQAAVLDAFTVQKFRAGKKNPSVLILMNIVRLLKTTVSDQNQISTYILLVSSR